jgi:AMP phosphorylase
VGPEYAEVKSIRSGKVIWLSTDNIVRIAREAGAPKEKGAGMILHAKLGEAVHKGSVLYEIYAEKSSKLTSALELAKQLPPVLLTNKPAEKMVLDQVPEKLAHEKTFSLDR